MKGPAGKKTFDAWIKSLIETYNNAHKLGISGIGTDDKYTMISFLNAVRRTHDTFYSSWITEVEKDRKKSFIELVVRFEDFVRSAGSNAVYAAFGNKNSESSSGGRNDKKKPIVERKGNERGKV